MNEARVIPVEREHQYMYMYSSMYMYHQICTYPVSYIMIWNCLCLNHRCHYCMPCDCDANLNTQCHVIEDDHRVVELRIVMWYMNKIRVQSK